MSVEDSQKIAFEVFFSHFSEQEKQHDNIKDSIAIFLEMDMNHFYKIQ